MWQSHLKCITFTYDQFCYQVTLFLCKEFDNYGTDDIQHLKNGVYNRRNSMVNFLLSSLLLFYCGRLLLWFLAICCLRYFFSTQPVLKKEVADKKRRCLVHPGLNYSTFRNRIGRYLFTPSFSSSVVYTKREILCSYETSFTSVS